MHRHMKNTKWYAVDATSTNMSYWIVYTWILKYKSLVPHPSFLSRWGLRCVCNSQNWLEGFKCSSSTWAGTGFHPWGQEWDPFQTTEPFTEDDEEDLTVDFEVMISLAEDAQKMLSLLLRKLNELPAALTVVAEPFSLLRMSFHWGCSFEVGLKGWKLGERINRYIAVD